jgi:hypothetical protein
LCDLVGKHCILKHEVIQFRLDQLPWLFRQ